MAKQTGRGCGVKGGDARRRQRTLAGAALAASVLLTACAGGWINAAKSSQETRADEKACSAEAEDTTLAQRARQKVDYGAPSTVQPGMNRGETPMQMVDRTRTEDTFTREFESCMRAKGYSPK